VVQRRRAALVCVGCVAVALAFSRPLDALALAKPPRPAWAWRSGLCASAWAVIALATGAAGGARRLVAFVG